MKQRNLILVRHGQSEWNEKNLFTGWENPGLTQKGEKEAKDAGKIINGLCDLFMEFFILSIRPKLSLLTLFLFIEIEPIFFKYHPKIGIVISSFFRINTGELKMV